MPELAAFPKCFLNDILIHRSMTLFDWIEKASQLGIDGLEMYFPFFENMDGAFIEKVVETCHKSGLKIPMMCFSPDYTQPDSKKRLEELEKQKAAIDLTVKLGGRFCRTLTGQARPNLAQQQAVRWCVEMIRESVAYAAERGIVINIENHYKDGYWKYPEFALKSDVFLEIVDQIDSPFFGINFDPSNAIIAGEDPIELLQKIRDRVVTIHASDRYLEGGTISDLREKELDPVFGYAGLIQHGVIGKGLNDYDAIFHILKGAGFDGWVSIEDGLNGMEELQQSVLFLRGKLTTYFGDSL